MRKQGSLDGIILLVISFSVINYVVSKSVRLRQADTLFFVHLRAQKKSVNPVSLTGEESPETPSVAPLRSSFGPKPGWKRKALTAICEGF